jgi:hypothetical protein
MPGLVPGIHVFAFQGVDGRDKPGKPGHDARFCSLRRMRGDIAFVVVAQQPIGEVGDRA